MLLPWKQMKAARKPIITSLNGRQSIERLFSYRYMNEASKEIRKQLCLTNLCFSSFASSKQPTLKPIKVEEELKW